MWLYVCYRLGLVTKLFTINPKDRSVIELYGILDPNTRDWTDGLLSNIFREINRPTDKNEKRYIVFDGDVDALWVENMNSVMDDNRLLTLANGERIRLQKHCALLFEVCFSINKLYFLCVYTTYSNYRQNLYSTVNNDNILNMSNDEKFVCFLKFKSKYVSIFI